MLSASGLPVIEATSFVSPKWVPQVGVLSPLSDNFSSLDCTETTLFKSKILAFFTALITNRFIY